MGDFFRYQCWSPSPHRGRPSDGPLHPTGHAPRADTAIHIKMLHHAAYCFSRAPILRIRAGNRQRPSTVISSTRGPVIRFHWDAFSTPVEFRHSTLPRNVPMRGCGAAVIPRRIVGTRNIRVHSSGPSGVAHAR